MELAENCTYTRVLNDRAEAVDDATAGMIIVILLFVLPSSLSFWPFVERMRNRGLVRKYATGARHLQTSIKLWTFAYISWIDNIVSAQETVSIL